MFFKTTDDLSALQEKLEDVGDMALLDVIYHKMWNMANTERLNAYVDDLVAE